MTRAADKESSSCDEKGTVASGSICASHRALRCQVQWMIQSPTRLKNTSQTTTHHCLVARAAAHPQAIRARIRRRPARAARRSSSGLDDARRTRVGRLALLVQRRLHALRLGLEPHAVGRRALVLRAQRFALAPFSGNATTLHFVWVVETYVFTMFHLSVKVISSHFFFLKLGALFTSGFFIGAFHIFTSMSTMMRRNAAPSKCKGTGLPFATYTANATAKTPQLKPSRCCAQAT